MYTAHVYIYICIYIYMYIPAEMAMGWVHPWIGLGWVGLGRVGSKFFIF
jgi:hypothetical protein